MINPDQTISDFDKYLPIFLPLISALVGGIFTLIVVNLTHSKQKKHRLYEEQLKIYGGVYKKLVQIKNEIENIHLFLKDVHSKAISNSIDLSTLNKAYLNTFSDLKKIYTGLFEIFYSSYLFEDNLFNKISFLYNEMAKVIVVYPHDINKSDIIECFIKVFDETLNSFRGFLGISKSPIATIPRPEKIINDEFKRRYEEIDKMIKSQHQINPVSE